MPNGTLTVDIDPKQMVRWIIAEHRTTPSSLKIVARRAAEERQIPARAEFHLGDEEREDLSEVATVANLEIAPAHPSDGWLMTIAVEDEGCITRARQGHDGGGRGADRSGKPSTASSFAPNAEPQPWSRRPAIRSRERVSSLLASIENDRHGPGAGKEARAR